MHSDGTIHRITRLIGTGRRRTVLIGIVSLAVVAAVVVPLSLRDGRSAPPAKIFKSQGCSDAPTIDALPAARSDGAWTDLVVPEAEPCATLGATEADRAGISLTTAFVLTASEAISPTSVHQRLVVEPGTPFDVKQEAATRFRITPKAPLSPGAVYRVALFDPSGTRPVTRWAFQTKSPLRVVQTLPRNEATEIPLNIGVELTFSHDDVEGVQERFSISPKTEGRFEVHNRVVVFVPDVLRPRTLYTVTLKPGARVAGSKEMLRQPFTFRFETGSTDRSGETPGDPAVQFGRGTWESATSEPPVVSLFLTGDGKPPTTLPFKVYRFGSVRAFVDSLDRFTAIPSWASSTRSAFVASTTGLEEAVSFKGRLQPLGDQGEMFVRFPDTLPRGFYLVTTEHKGTKIQTWLQVTDVATYAAVSNERTLVWANDVARKRPLPDATVSVYGAGSAGKTAGDGVASFKTPSGMIRLTPSEYGEEAEIVKNLIVTAADGRLAVVPLADLFTGFHSFEFRSYTFSGDPSPYWRFLFVDRDLYRPTDTVRFWGLIRNRVAPERRDLTIELVGGYDERHPGPVTLATTTVKPTATGTFIGELSFAGITPGYYDVQAKIGKRYVASTSVQVEDFVKPAYKIDVASSKNAVLSGDPVRYAVSTSFFEGSPVPELALRYELEDGPGRTAQTDDAGRATVQFRPTTQDVIAYRPIRVFPTLAEEGEISGGASVQVFPATVAMRSVATMVPSGRVNVDGVVFNVDFAGLNSPNGDPYDIEGAPAPGRRVTARVTEISWRRQEAGTTYDFISKIVRKRFTYHEVRRDRGRFSDISDGRGRFSIAFSGNEKRSYEIDLRVTDAAGRAFTETTWAYAGYDFNSTFPYLKSVHNEGPYPLGAQVDVTMYRGEEAMPSGGDQRYLFYLASNGIRGHSVRARSSYRFTFDESLIPNVEVLGVRFNGITYEEVAYGYAADFAFETRRLSVAVEPAKPRYRPGETAQLSVRVTDARGRPVRAEVLLSAVDEALFRVHPESFFRRDILESLYDAVPAGVLGAYASHQFPSTFEGAEHGGEGGERVDFRDVGIFRAVTTGADGRATAPFELPDNVTSWRITALAVTNGLSAGSTVALVPVGLPVFADVGLNDSYLVSDRPLVRMRAFGSDLRSSDAVSFKLETPSLSKEVRTASGRAFAPVDLPLPNLREGTHRVRVTVAARGRTDTVVRTITVVPSRLLRVQVAHDEVSAGGSFVPSGSADRLTSVVISDHNRGRYYPALESLAWTQGDRVDQMLARNTAQELLTEYFEEPAPFPAVFRPTAYQTPDGGIGIFPFADDDLTISARIAALDAEPFGRQGLLDFFTIERADREATRERGIIALYGLAALGEPVIADVQRAAASRVRARAPS